jgi:hypothetical protein
MPTTLSKSSNLDQYDETFLDAALISLYVWAVPLAETKVFLKLV